jgi:hypothetical protein
VFFFRVRPLVVVTGPAAPLAFPVVVVAVRAFVCELVDDLVVFTWLGTAGEQVKECAGVAGVQRHHRAAVTNGGDSVDPGGAQCHGDGFCVNRHAVSSGFTGN